MVSFLVCDSENNIIHTVTDAITIPRIGESIRVYTQDGDSYFGIVTDVHHAVRAYPHHQGSVTVILKQTPQEHPITQTWMYVKEAEEIIRMAREKAVTK